MPKKKPQASTGGSSSDPVLKKQKQSTAGSSTDMPKQTIIKTAAITKQTLPQLAPSVIGIQRLREAFLEAKK